MPQASDERLLYTNPLDGSKTYFSYSHNDLAPSKSTMTLRTEEDVEPLVELNKRLINSHDASTPGLFSDGRAMYKVGQITNNEHADLVKRGIMSQGWEILDDFQFSKWFNDREFMYLRKTTTKKV